jgi:hypothetical protein
MGELGFVMSQRVMACRDGHFEARLQVSELAELANDPSAHLMDHIGDVSISRWTEFHKSGLESLGDRST